MASDPRGDPNVRQPIERIPFDVIEKAYDRWVMDKWVALTIAIFMAGIVIFLVLAFSSDDVVFDIPQVLYAVGTLLVASGISVLLLGVLVQEARGMIRDIAQFGTSEETVRNRDPHIPGFWSEGTAPATRGGAIAYTQILNAATSLPTPRFLIIFGLGAMLLGAGLDGKWTMPSISFEVEPATSTPAAPAAEDSPSDADNVADPAPAPDTDATDDGNAPAPGSEDDPDPADDGNSPPPGEEDSGGPSGGDGT